MMDFRPGMTFHLTEREGSIWLATKYPKHGPWPGSANRRLYDLGTDRPSAEAVLEDFQKRVKEAANV